LRFFPFAVWTLATSLCGIISATWCHLANTICEVVDLSGAK